MQVLYMIMQLLVSGLASVLQGLFFGAGFALGAAWVDRMLAKFARK